MVLPSPSKTGKTAVRRSRSWYKVIVLVGLSIAFLFNQGSLNDLKFSEEREENAATQHETFSQEREEKAPTQKQSKLALALHQIRTITTNASAPLVACPTPITSEKHPERGRRSKSLKKCTFDTPWEDPTSARRCGRSIDGSTATFKWECRLKERLYESIRKAKLTECSFGFLDVGTRTGDWVVALSGFKNAILAAIEVHPQVFLEMIRELSVNNLLSEGRVTPYPCAVGVTNAAVFGVVDANTTNTEVSWTERSNFVKVESWPGSVLCVPVGSDLGGLFETVNLLSGGNKKSRCREQEVEAPIASIDLIMADWQVSKLSSEKKNGQLAYGGLFASKIDVEGAELEAIKSAAVTFVDEQQRPCQLILEMKTNDVYAQAFQLILSLGYTDVIDVDSGVTGNSSYPPKGTLWRGEGNYEFRLAPEEYEKCVQRVRLATSV